MCLPPKVVAVVGLMSILRRLWPSWQTRLILGEVGADAVELEAVQEAQDDQAEVGEDAEEVVAIFINMLHETL